ncbi:MAG: addiction module protein [Acidobacteriota bacterium]
MARKIQRKFQEIESELLQLNPHLRATLAKSLLDSLETLSDEEYEGLWAEEAEARYADFKAGRTKAVNGEGVLARARARSR